MQESFRSCGCCLKPPCMRYEAMPCLLGCLLGTYQQPENKKQKSTHNKKKGKRLRYEVIPEGRAHSDASEGVPYD